MKYKKALITGGAGFIGSHLAERLIRDKIEVVILDNLSTGKISNVPNEAKCIKGDILDFDLLKNIIHDQVDIVFHQAAVVSIRASVGNFFHDIENNIMGTINILRALQGTQVQKVIFASSMAVYADSPAPEPLEENYKTEPISPYGISKLASEKYILNICKNMGIKSVILRYFNTYGIRQAYTPYVGVITIFINKLLKNQSPEIFGDGKQKRDFVSVGDVIEANIRAMHTEISDEVFNIGTGKATSVSEIAQLLLKYINPSIKPVYGPPQPGELRFSIANIDKARKLLGYSPVSNLEKDIREVIEYIKSH